MAIDPVDANVMFAGTGTPSKPGIFRSTDAGKTWERLAVDIARGVPERRHPAPDGHRRSTRPTIGTCGWASRSTASGTAPTAARRGRGSTARSRTRTCTTCWSIAGPPKTVFTVVNDDVWRSTDDGATWQAARAREAFPWHYPRGHRGEARRSEDGLRHARRLDAGPHRHRHALARRRRDVAEPGAARAAELRDLDGEHSRRGAGHGVRGQPLRLPLSQRRRRRLVAQALARVRRGVVDRRGCRGHEGRAPRVGRRHARQSRG